MSATPRYRGLRRTTSRSALLTAAEELFGLRGFSEVSVDEITARAGVAKGTFYNHFEGKADLAHHLALEIRAGVRERIGALKSFSDDPAMHLAIAMGSFMLLAVQRPNRALILVTLLGNPTDAKSPMNARVRETLETGLACGRFKFTSVESALVLVLGIVSVGIRNLLEQPVGDPRRRIAELLAHALCALGLGWQEARGEIARTAMQRL
jgi:AcrR family transcriptional regulator